MRFLFCCEFYFPSVGGVQEVMRQLAERLVGRGHEVVVATTRLANRNFTEHNGVQIVEFGIHGNNARGIVGEIDRYLNFVCDFQGDALMIKAAQQWTFDALWPVLDRITMRKVFIPCGFSGLYEPLFEPYFRNLPAILRKFDHLIFYAERYRDIDFARANGICNFTVLPNGASEQEFDVSPDPGFRACHGIGEDEFVFLTVGSLNGMKGHRELAEAFCLMKPNARRCTLILNGNIPPKPELDLEEVVRDPTSANEIDTDTCKKTSVSYLSRSEARLTGLAAYLAGRTTRVAGLAYRSIGVIQREGLAGARSRVQNLVHQTLIYRAWVLYRREGVTGVRTRLGDQLVWRLPGVARYFGIEAGVKSIEYWVTKTNAQSGLKRIVVTDFGRADLVQAYMAADLFVFASNVEYSPLVLFETTAAGTPFLSVPVGNAEEIAPWTCGGNIFPARKDERGYTWADPVSLAVELESYLPKRAELEGIGRAARQIWKSRFTWDKISRRYEDILSNKTN